MRKFEVTTMHIRMVQRLNIQHATYSFPLGAPAVDEKRPYGNSDVIQDIAEMYIQDLIEGGPIRDGRLIDNDGELFIIAGDRVVNSGDSLEAVLVKFHEEMDTVLEILVQSLELQVGRYQKAGYSDPWHFVEPDQEYLPKMGYSE